MKTQLLVITTPLALAAAIVARSIACPPESPAAPQQVAAHQVAAQQTAPQQSGPQGAPQQVESPQGMTPQELAPSAGKRGDCIRMPGTPAPTVTVCPVTTLPTARPIAPFTQKGIDWLVAAQHPSGGWGAGSHANQENRDPHTVQVDPATTAFAAMALIRAGHTPVAGKYRDVVRRATEHLLAVVEDSPAEGPRITDLQGTQPQSKLGPFVDTSMTAQFFARVLHELPDEDLLRVRVNAALDRCLAKLQASQQKDGSWGGGGWAPVLQSSLGCQALEMAAAAGKDIDRDALDKARQYQVKNFDVETGRADASAAAGVELYAIGGAQRAGAGLVRAASQIIEEGKKEGKLAPNAEVSVESLRTLGYTANDAKQLATVVANNEKQIERLSDEAMLSGFGSNGGEEFLSYLLTSESLVLAGGEAFVKWNDKMHGLLAKIQSNDGSWTGHHCITSPVFCTAAVVQCLTVDRDAALLARIADADVAAMQASEKKK